jgi:predicted O-methyltransferase YrrM
MTKYWHDDPRFRWKPTQSFLDHPSLYTTMELLAALFQPRRYLEIGIREGESLTRVVQNSAALQEIVICDPWGTEHGGSGRGSHAHIAGLLSDLTYQGRVDWLDGDSHKVLKSGILGREFDLILVDGDHSEAGATQDLMETYEHLAPYGYLVFDDITHPVYPFLQAVARRFIEAHHEFRLALETLDQGSGLSIMARRQA